MRLYPVLALMTSAFALAACGGGGAGGFGSSVLGVSSGVSNSCPITLVDNTPDPTCTGTIGPTTPPAVVDTDGDGVPDVDEDVNDGSIGSGAGGNTTGLSAGDRTLLSKKFIFDEPTTAATALSTVRSSATATAAQTTAAILSASKPTSLTYAIDTKSASNSEIAVQVAMGEDRNKTRDLLWVTLGHHTFATSGLPMTNGMPDLLDANGNRTIQFISGSYVHTTNDTVGTVDFLNGDLIEYRDDLYWNQLSALMDSRANGGAGADYREYRIWDRSANGTNRDELMQVWAFDDSYAIQYQNSSLAEDPKHHAWSYGGNAAANMPTSGQATYRGRFVGHAKTENFEQGSAIVNPNARWTIQGRSTFNTDFGTGAIRGTLRPETWISDQDAGTVLWNTSAADNPSVGTADSPNFRLIYENQVLINGTITGNTFSGSALLSQGFDTGDNSALGGFYGATGDELTGVFVSDGAIQSPFGGSGGIVENKEGYLTITGAFNANCTNPNSVCAP